MYEELELWYPYHRLREAGVEVDLVGPAAGTYQGRFGYPAEAPVAAADVDAAGLAGVVVPGGYAPDRMRRHSAMVGLVRQVYAQGGVVAAICHAGWLLVEADILRGHTVTGFFSIRQDLVNAGARYVDEPVVVDGPLVTSRQPADLPEFGAALVKSLA
ncbi:MAG: DJ-1/PfpI/YhbO family deglycase/protease [Micromonosporaceae bacterium]|nr:DJ-1/PfpI/YhbO family deglycase/protease [Micromonosporaceae bacterium]